MNTTPPPPPPPPAPSTADGRRHTGERWRRPLADLLDLLVVLVVAGAAGAGVALLLSLDSQDDPWAGLAAALLGLGVAAAVALVGWVAVLIAIAIGRPTPGMRVARPVGSVRPVATAARHVALVTATWATMGAAASLSEPPPVGPLGGAAAAAVAAAALVAAYGWGPVRTRVAIVVGALVVGGVVAGAVPDRAPYTWELHDTATAALVAALDADPTAERLCPAAGAVGQPRASHRTGDCARPDRSWRVTTPPTVTAERLRVAAAAAVGDEVDVTWDRRYDEIVVQLGSDVVAIVTATPDCASRVVLDRYDVAADLEQPTCG